MQESRSSVLHLQWLIFGSLFTLIGTLVWLATMVYREMIAPLKLQLIESHAIIERQEKLASLGVLAAGVAHEIRNPLTAITARLFRHEKTLGKDPSKLEDVRIIGKELNRLEQIIKEFLQFARPSEPVLLPVKAADILTEVSDLFAPHLKGQSIDLRVESETDAFIKADSKQLQQVLINLITNASESIGEGGEITLRARTGNARLIGRQTPVVILEVEDSGKGISPEVQRRLFDPFFSTKEGGTGLGLAISARIIEMHGGLLEFQTQLNRGTTFGIVLPIYLENANPS